MNRQAPHVDRQSLAVRLASLGGAVLLSLATIATLVEAMPPLTGGAALATATEVTIQPSRIEVVGVRNPAKPRVG